LNRLLNRQSLVFATTCASLLLVLGIGACDTVHPSREGTLVIESFLRAGQALPPVWVARTWSINTKSIPGSGGIAGADVELVLDGQTYRYSDAPDSAGLYVPDVPDHSAFVSPMSVFLLRVRHDGQEATAGGFIPPLITLSNVHVTVPDEAIEAVFLDSLDIGIDSLNLSVDARKGFIYPVQVDLSWDPPETGAEASGTFWIETLLKPRTEFSSSIVDFFLLPKQILPEEAAEIGPGQTHHWRGVYAVPVDMADSPLPEHGLEVFLLRGDQQFAKFETSRDTPERREPETNVQGGIGFVGGIAVDSLSLIVH